MLPFVWYFPEVCFCKKSEQKGFAMQLILEDVTFLLGGVGFLLGGASFVVDAKGSKFLQGVLFPYAL